MSPKPLPGTRFLHLITALLLTVPVQVGADELQLKPDHPERYTVVKGDTLWDISAKFFKDPWKWPEIWALNKEAIKDPHWIYPGDVVFLDRRSGTLTTTEPAAVDTSAASDVAATPEPVTPSSLVKLQPKVRVVGQNTEAIPAVPLSKIASFLSRPLVIDSETLETAPRIVGTYEQRTLLSSNDVAYVGNLPVDQGKQWQVYRPNVKFVDPDTDEDLGQEVVYLGDASVEKFGDPSTLRITSSVLEINKGDYLAQIAPGHSPVYIPHAPESSITAKVISIYGGVQQAGQHAVVTLNKGRRDGIEAGHILALYQKGEELKTKGWFTPNINLPDVRYGLLMVFRVFDKVSYALVMESKIPVQTLDSARTPD
jgi:hypothetical protein